MLCYQRLMFNEILTGKASLEEKPAAADPYREPSVPDVSMTCPDCHKTFTTKVGSGATKCAVCHVLSAQAATAASGHTYENVHEAHLRSGTNAKLVSLLVTVGLGIGLVIFKYQMRKQSREDLYSPRAVDDSAYNVSRDPFVESVAGHRREMCSCSDLACSRVVQAKFENWLRSQHQMPMDDATLDAAAVETSRYTECMTRLEAQERGKGPDGV